MPMPAIGASLSLTPFGGLRLTVFARGTWIENMPTWHDGTRHSQTVLDTRAEVSYRAGPLEFGLSLQHQSLYLGQDNREDGNQLLLRGMFLKLFLVIRL